MTRNHPRSLLCSSIALALVLAPSLPVLAATTAATDATLAPDEGEAAAPAGDPEALSGEAVKKFQAKEYDEAVELFEKAYAIDPQPNYLFNIGRVYEEKGDLENAVVFYQRFVGQSGVDLDSRQTATERLKVLREALEQMKASEEPAEEEPAEETTEPAEETTEPENTGEDDGAKRKKTLRITGYSLLGVGGGALIVGAIFGGVAQGTANDAEADEFVDRRLALAERAQRQAVVADAMFITGGILATAGLVLVLTTLDRKKNKGGDDAVARRTVWSPVLGPRQVGLGLTHRF